MMLSQWIDGEPAEYDTTPYTDEQRDFPVELTPEGLAYLGVPHYSMAD